jgi:threonine synthase
VPAVEPLAPSVAEGLAIAEPVRGRRLLQAIRETGGMCVVVKDDAILQAQRRLAHQGLYIEPTSATAVAALEVVLQQAVADETVVVPLTGSGLKGSPSLT